MPKRMRAPYVHKTLATLFPKERELAWQAGIMDGEGTITISRQDRKGRPSPAFRPFVTITNTKPDLVVPFAQLWGGHIYKTVDVREEKKWSDSFDWYCPHISVQPFLYSILPYLRAKQKQAELVIEFMETARAFPRYIGSSDGKTRGGSAPLGKAEVKHREKLKKEIQMLNAKSMVYRATVK